MTRPERKSKGSALIDLCVVWIITVLAYGVVGVLRGQQLIRDGLDRLRPGRDWL